MRILIAEDEPLARSLLRALLAGMGDIEIVGEAKDAREAIALAGRLRPDVVFLDVDMPGANGISAAHELQSRSPAEIVFVTAHEPYAADAFDLGAADYVLKPVRRPRLASALERVRARLRERRLAEIHSEAGNAVEPDFWVRTRQGRIRVHMPKVMWIEAARDHVYLHTSGQSYLHRITMAELEEKLRGTAMVRVQRSAFVRLDKVTAILRRRKSMVLQLEDLTEVAVGPNYVATTLAALTAAETSKTAR